MTYFKKPGYMFYENDTVDYKGRNENCDILFARRAERIIRHHATVKPPKPLFLYVSPEAMHLRDKYKPFTRRQAIASLQTLDQVVGDIMNALIETKLYKNSIVVFFSDNGGDPNFGGNNLPLRGKKETLWEGGLRVPAFIHSPLLPKKGVVSRQLFHVTDWLPTLLQAAGAGPETVKQDGWDGIGQWNALQALQEQKDGSTTAGPRTDIVLNLNYNAFGRLEGAYREGPYKLIINPLCSASDWIRVAPEKIRDFKYSLYNVEVDPNEKVNLARTMANITHTLAAKVRENIGTFFRHFLNLLNKNTLKPIILVGICYLKTQMPCF
jgi:arylsulfatase A-like enzyme